MDRRSDYKTALLIEDVLYRRPEGLAAARELANLGVPLGVAVRVLTKPNERRHQVSSPNSS